jgi:hypothetical protein
MKCIYLLLLFLFPAAIYSQNVQGIIYDSESKLKDIKVTNLSKRITTYSDDAGNFSLPATVNDTLVFYSLFYEQKRKIIAKDDFESKMVVELKKIMNDLGEVVLTDRSKTKEFDAEVYSTDLKNQIAEDIKNNPHLYTPVPRYGLDFVAVASLIFKLFKKDKAKPEVIEPLNYKQFEELFSKDEFLNDKFLVNELEIPLEYKPLFFDYLDAQNINGTFILEEKKMLLLEELFKHSKGFKAFLTDYEQGKIKD